VTEHLPLHIAELRRHRRIESGDRFPHRVVAVLTAFTTSVVGLHGAINRAIDPVDNAAAFWDEQAAMWAKSAVQCARLLTIKGEYR
jgi:hypothetical protein